MRNATGACRQRALLASPLCEAEGCDAGSTMAMHRPDGSVLAVCFAHHTKLCVPLAPPSGSVFERRRPDRLNAAESAELERFIRDHGIRRVMTALGVASTTLDNLRHSGPATKATIARVRAGLAKGMP